MDTVNVLGPSGDLQAPVPPRLSPVDFAREKALAIAEHLELIESDGIPMDSLWHVYCMNLLIEQIECHFRDRSDYFVAGNMFIYFSVVQARNLDYRGPDFFYVSKTTREPMRRFWVVWEEKRTPDVVIELASPTTKSEDYGPKFAIYRDRLQVGNYFIYDPDTRVLDGWQLQGVDYVPIARRPNGRLWSDRIGLELGEWHGKHMGFESNWLRWFSPDGKVAPTFAEAEKQHSEAERRRRGPSASAADAAVAEIDRLKKLLAQQQTRSANGTSPNS